MRNIKLIKNIKRNKKNIQKNNNKTVRLIIKKKRKI
jgi:hypothetical protein